MYICASRSGIFTCILPVGSCILSVHMHSWPWLAPDTVLAVRSSMVRDGTSAGNDMDREPGTGDGKPGTRDGASGTTGYGKPGTGDGEPECGTRNQGVPGTADGRARDGTSAGNNMDCEPGTGDSKPGTRDCAVQRTCVHARLLNTYTHATKEQRKQPNIPLYSIFTFRSW